MTRAAHPGWVRRGWMVAAVVATTVGCGGGLVDVTGTVTFDGAPLEGATVAFIPEGPGVPASGITDGKGRFRLAIGSGRAGVPRGRYGVTVTKVSVSVHRRGEVPRPATDASHVETAPHPDGLVEVISHLVPRAYADAGTSGLRAEVDGTTDVSFALRSAE